MLAERGSDLAFTIEQRRAGMQAFSDSRPLPAGVVYEEQTLGPVRSLTISPEGGANGDILLIHGGAFVLGSPETHRGLGSRIALVTGCRLHLIDYRLAPEHIFPAAIEDCVAAARALAARTSDYSIVGDSAGGGLTVATACRLRDAGAVMPKRLLLVSPWVDHRLTAQSLDQFAEADLILSKEGLSRDSAYYRAGTSPLDPLVSPLLAELGGLPPALVQVGGTELLLDDAHALAEAMAAAGVGVRLEIWEGMIHAWYAFGEIVPEGRQAIEAGASWLTEGRT
jgi:acetyl esterase/lipase